MLASHRQTSSKHSWSKRPKTPLYSDVLGSIFKKIVKSLANFNYLIKHRGIKSVSQREKKDQHKYDGKHAGFRFAEALY